MSWHEWCSTEVCNQFPNIPWVTASTVNRSVSVSKRLTPTVWQTGLPGSSVVKNAPAMQETQVPSLVRKIPGGAGHGNPLQDSCLENPMDGGALGYGPWGHKSHTRLKGLSTRTRARQHLRDYRWQDWPHNSQTKSRCHEKPSGPSPHPQQNLPWGDRKKVNLRNLKKVVLKLCFCQEKSFIPYFIFQ